MKNALIVLSLIILLAGAVYFKNTSGGSVDKNKLKTEILPKVLDKLVSPGTKYTIAEIKETNNIYEVTLALGEGANAKKYTSYITKDGKIFFTSGIKIEELNKPTPKPEAKKTVSCADLKKTDKPLLTAFVVSECPYGIQMQRVFKKALNELSTLADYLEIRYIGDITNGKITAMHGDKEAQENLKQICIREEQKEKYWNYLSCYMQEGKTDECLGTAGIDTSALESCTTDPNKGLKYAKTDFDLANKYGVSGSPTLLINDQIVSEFDFGGRNANAVKEIVGCSFKTKPEAFQKELTKTDVAVAFSKTDDATQNAGASASCATQ